MFELEFSEKVNGDIVSVLKYIGEVLQAPKAAENHIVLLYRFLYCRRDWINILIKDAE